MAELTLYKTIEVRKDYHSVTAHHIYGFIDEKKVDKFNGKVKVFIPLAQRYETEYRERLWQSESRIGSVEIYNHDASEWQHISSLTLDDVHKKEIKAVKQALKEVVKQKNKELGVLSSVLAQL